MEQVRQGFVKECAKCGCNFADMDSPIPPMHISEIPEDTRKTLSAGYMEYVKISTRYGYCSGCLPKSPSPRGIDDEKTKFRVRF